MMRAILRERLLLAGLLLLALLALAGVLAPWLVDTSLAEIGSARPRRPPGGAHLLGTDTQGRDVLAALLLALPQTLWIGLMAGLIGLGVGCALGLLAGWFRGATDAVIRTLADVAMTIPAIAVLVLIAVNVRSMTVGLMALTVAGLAWMVPARAVRAQVLSLRERPWVDIARLNGVGPLRLILTEILPNLVPYLAASFAAAVSGAMLATVGLEALGLGPQNELTLGMMFYWAQYGGAVLRGMWWWWVPPVVALALIFLSLLAISAGLDRLANARLRVAP
ncbi:ABC transporter permease [Falsiroseomonas sp. HW251]|uniref:ABC transporter permease n=1 Tax=Falsiroseomonas sp. HW251 TaxID=3390998 RepID=UPI003D320003